MSVVSATQSVVFCDGGLSTLSDTVMIQPLIRVTCPQWCGGRSVISSSPWTNDPGSANYHSVNPAVADFKLSVSYR